MTITRLAPDTIAASANLTGAVTDIDDDPLSPDGLWLTGGDDGTSTDLRVTFPSPSSDLNTGAGLQKFQVWARKFVDATGTDPDLGIELWENGSLVSQLSLTSVTSATGEIFSATWDATLLSAVSGANVELRCRGNVSGGSPGNRRSVEFGAVDWLADHVSSTKTGTLAATDTIDTAAFTGGITGNGTLAATDAVDTASFTGDLKYVGTLAATDAVDTAAFTGDLKYTGTLATTDAVDTAAFTGGVTVSGTLAATDAVDAAAFTGNIVTATVTGTLGATDAVDTAAFTGDLKYTGTLAATDAADTAAFTGDLKYIGTLAATDAADTAAFTGDLKYIGTLVATDAVDVASMTGEVTVSGTLSGTDAVDTSAFTGNVVSNTISGTLSSTDPVDVAAFTGGVTVSGVLGATDAVDVAAFTGGVNVSGVLGATDPVDVAAFTGNVVSATKSGTLSATDPVDAASFTGDVDVIASGGLNEVAPGAYDLTGKSGNRYPAYDFVNRRWWAVSAGTGPSGEDMLQEYSMADHSLTSEVAITWPAGADGMRHFAFWDHLSGNLWIEYIDGSVEGISIIDPVTGGTVAHERHSGGTSGNGYWSVFDWDWCEVGGQAVLISQSVFDNKLELSAMDGIGGVPLFASISGWNGNGFVIGHIVIDETYTALYWSTGANGVIKETVISLAGIFSQRDFWTPAHGFQDVMIDPGDNNMVFISGQKMSKYETAGETFANIWQTGNILSNGSMGFGREHITQPIERVGVFGVVDGQNVHVVTLYDGSLVETIIKSGALSINATSLAWDDLGSSAWYHDLNTSMWRWQGSVKLNLSPHIDPDTGEGLGGHPPPRPINFERPRPTSSCDC